MRRKPQFEKLQSRRVLTADWQNPWRPLDANDDGSIAPLDALVGINRLNEGLPSSLPNRPADSTEPYYDTNGDQFHTAIDVLLIINAINSGQWLQANLKNDTGFGINGSTDHVTSDPTIRGAAPAGTNQLRARLDGKPWIDVSEQITPGGNFELSPVVLKQLAGGALADGPHRIDVESSNTSDTSQLVDRAFLSFELDTSLPIIQEAGEILMTTPRTLVIPFNEVLSPGSIALDELKVFDISWGEKADNSEWSMDGNNPRLAVRGVSARVSTDGFALIVSLPDAGRSVKYLLELGPIVEDLAGNRFNADSSGNPRTVRANYFASQVPILQFGESYRSDIELSQRITEYQFELTTADSLLWSGNIVFGGLARYELYNEQGQLLAQLWPGTLQEPGPAQQPAIIPLEAGKYRWRVVDPPTSFGHFRIYRISELPDMPDSRSSGNTEPWPMDAYRLSIANDQRAYFQALESQKPLRAVLDTLGGVAQPILLGNDQYLETPGQYTVLVNRTAYQRFLSSPTTISVDNIDAPVIGSISTPGQVVKVSLPVTPGKLYRLDPKVSSDLRLTIQLNSSQLARLDDHWYLLPSSQRLVLQLERLSSRTDPAEYEFRLTEVVAPALPIGVWINNDASSEYQQYLLPPGQRVMFDGQRIFVFLEASPGRLAMYQDSGHAIFPELNQEVLNRWVIVKNVPGASPWRALTAETRLAPLSFDEANALTFESGLETYEFSFEGQPGEFISTQLSAAENTPTANLLNSALRLWDAYGREVEPVGFSPARNLWQIDRPGVYRVVVNNEFGVDSLGTAQLWADRSGAWSTLPLELEATVAARSRQVLTIPSSIRTIYFNAPTGVGSGTKFKLFDQAGQSLLGTDPFGTDFWFNIPENAVYYLEVDNRQGFEPFVFTAFDSDLTKVHAKLDEVYALPFAGRGDRIRLEFELQRGQRISGIRPTVESPVHMVLAGPNGLPIQLKEHWYDPDPAVWLVPDSGVYTLEFRNASDSPNDLSIQLKEQSSIAIGRSFFTSDTVNNGNLTRTSENAGLMEIAFQAEAGAVLIFDWLGAGFDPRWSMAIRDANDQPLVYQEMIRDSRPVVLPQNGQYRLQLGLNQDTQSAPYRFALRDLSQAPELTLGEQRNLELDAFALKWYRLEVPQVEDVELVNAGYNLVEISLEALDAGASTAVSGATWPRSLSAGTHAILVSSQSKEASQVAFSTLLHEHIQPLTLDYENRFALAAGTVLTQFTTNTPGTRISLQASRADLLFKLFDQRGIEVPGVLGDEPIFDLTVAGTYRLEISVPAGSGAPIDSVWINTLPPIAQTVNLGDVAIKDQLAIGTKLRYTFEVSSDGMFWWQDTGGVNSELIDSQGRSVPLARVMAPDSATVQPRHLQYLKAGQYTYLTNAGDGRVTLVVSPWSLIPLIGLGTHSGTLDASMPQTIMRYRLQADTPVRLSISAGTQIMAMTESLSMPHSLANTTEIVVDEEQYLFLLIMRNGREPTQGDPFSFTLA